LLAVAQRIVGRRDLAEDVVQDAFLQIWEKARRFHPGLGSARGWIYCVVRNHARNLRRARLRRDTTDCQLLLAVFDILDSAARLPEQCALHRHMADLDPRKRASVILAYVDGCTHREVAEQLGVPVGTAKAWIRRGLTALRAEIAGA
jgi:RNA polymerase sigma-70 factor (ECF subfamily)